MIQKTVRLISNVSKPDSFAPKTIKWKGHLMVRNQSFLASVKEIINYSTEMDVTRVGIIGDMHSGKTTLSKSIAHAIHKYSTLPYTTRIFYKKDLVNFVETLRSLNPTNYILIFDDVSFLKASATNKQINLIEQAITEIRHLEGGTDVKIICIFNYHYPKALPPFLREAQYKYITSIGDANEKNIADTYGKRNVDLVTGFKMTRKKAIKDKFWYERVRGQDPVKHLWRDPFIPVLFWNEVSIRKIVAPTRQFVDDVCSECDDAEGIISFDKNILGDIITEGRKANGKGAFDAAVKLVLYKHGFNYYGPSMSRTIRWIERERRTRSIPLSGVIDYYGFKKRQPKIGKSYDELKEPETEII